LDARPLSIDLGVMNRLPGRRVEEQHVVAIVWMLAEVEHVLD
jgi:hypothetical protein